MKTLRTVLPVIFAIAVVIAPLFVAHAAPRVLPGTAGRISAAAMASLLAAHPAPAPELEALLTAMDNASQKFKSAQADVKVDLYNRAADDTDHQTGTVYFRKKGTQTDMAAKFIQPERDIVYVDGCVNIFEKKIDQVTRYCADKNKEAVDSFLNIGFGGSGHALQKSFDVSYGGAETVDNKKTEKLELVPTTTKVKNMFTKITLWIWIDPSTQIALSVKQEFVQPSGDTRTSYYTNTQSPVKKLPENVFKVPNAKTCIDGSTGGRCQK